MDSDGLFVIEEAQKTVLAEESTTEETTENLENIRWRVGWRMTTGHWERNTRKLEKDQGNLIAKKIIHIFRD